MLKVLLAEDNYLILEYFRGLIPWADYGFEIAASATDGKKALLEYEKYEPELVITDIQMPKMTGIQLAEHILDTHPDTGIIFLTSYEDTAYLKSAIDLGVLGYLLKHETTPERLIELLDKAKRNIQAKKLQPYYASAPLYALIRDSTDPTLPEEAFYQYETVFPDKYNLIFLEQDHVIPAAGHLLGIQTEAVHERELLDVCSKVIPELTAMISTGPYSFLLLLRTGRPISEQSYQIQREVQQQFHVSFFELMIASDAPILTCAERYTYMLTLLGRRIFFPCASIAYVEYLFPRSQSAVTSPPDDVKTLLEERRFDQAASQMERLFATAIASRDSEGFCLLLEQYLKLLLGYEHKVVDFQTGLPYHVCDQTAEQNLCDAHACCQWLRYRFAELTRCLSSSEYFRYSGMTRQAIGYMSEHYANGGLSIDSIAEALHVPANTLNTLFKKETGETVWRFLVNLRMSRAKELLCTSNKSVSEICAESGYNSLAYFSKVFKSAFGMTPLEYRRTHYET